MNHDAVKRPSYQKEVPMQLPMIRGVIDRRILVNFRVDAGVLAKQLPPPFRPKLVDGFGIAGVCLIRLKQIRPQFFPAQIGLSSENAAHRIAIEWDDERGTHEGVYVPRRDTSSRLNTWFGGMMFPGEQHHATFKVVEHEGQYQVGLDSDDRQTHLFVKGHSHETIPNSSVFRSLKDASDFFERGSVGYSATRKPGEFDGLELRSQNWMVSPLEIEHVESSYFDEPARFPAGSLQLDCALLMRGIDHEWHGREPIVCPGCEGNRT